MKKQIKYKSIIFLIPIFILFIVPSKTLAATINSSAESTISSGDTSIINVYLNTEGQTINSIEGLITLKDEHNGNFEVKELSLVNSVFNIWPRKPSLEEGGKISFVGGIPNGINGDRILLFKIIVKINDSGKFSIIPTKVAVYLNDGLGTALDITKDTSVISVGTSSGNPQNKWQEIVSNDNVAPEPFIIKIVQDSSLFDGKKFLSFETTDSQSGISYYEVREGAYPAVRTGTSYILINQNKNVDVIVTAYDKAGNFQVSVLKAKEPIRWLSVIVTVLFIIMIFKIVKKFRKNKKKNDK